MSWLGEWWPLLVYVVGAVLTIFVGCWRLIDWTKPEAGTEDAPFLILTALLWPFPAMCGVALAPLLLLAVAGKRLQLRATRRRDAEAARRTRIRELEQVLGFEPMEVE